MDPVNSPMTLWRVHPDTRREYVEGPLLGLKNGWMALTKIAGQEPEHGFELRLGGTRKGQRVATANKMKIPGEGIAGTEWLQALL